MRVRFKTPSEKASTGGKGTHYEAPGLHALIGAPRMWQPSPVKAPLKKKVRIRKLKKVRVKGIPSPKIPTVCLCGLSFPSRTAYGQHKQYCYDKQGAD